MTLLSDFLHQLGVPYTAGYSDNAFRTMTFKSLFGFTRVLDSYGIESEALRLSDISRIRELPLPFLAQVKGSFVTVTSFDGAGSSEPTVSFRHFGKSRSMSLADFEKDATGVVLLAKAGKESREPDYTRHLFFDSISKGKTLLLVLSVVFLFAAGFAMSGLWRQLSSVLLTVVDIAGIAVTWLLILKTLKIKSKSADRICGVLQEHGCDHVLEQKASTFFGIFSWSEVGITYFAVSTLILILFPGEIHNLALINGCCLPFTVWSIWYQKFRIRTWCTLCVTTQCLLWLQFFCYFFGGWWKGIFPLRLPFFMIVAAYAAALLATNRLMNFIKNRNGSV